MVTALIGYDHHHSSFDPWISYHLVYAKSATDDKCKIDTLSDEFDKISHCH